MKELKLKACDSNLDKVLDEVEKYLRRAVQNEELIMTIKVACEEIFVNISHYAYGDNLGVAKVGMDLVYNPTLIRLTFRDRGIPYNPLEKVEPDFESDVMNRQIGGLGIFMVKEIMDKMDYKYVNGENVLTIEKAL